MLNTQTGEKEHQQVLSVYFSHYTSGLLADPCARSPSVSSLNRAA